MTLTLYVIMVLIWGSTWYAITFQLNGTAEEVSVAVRFILASIVLFIIGRLRRRDLRLSRAALPMVAVQGALMFCANYFMVYYGTNFIASGLMAILFTLLIPANLLNEYLFFRKPASRRVMLAGVLGLIGIALIFWPELRRTEISRQTVWGILLGIGAVYSASLGNMAALVNTGKKLPVTAVNAYGMLFGGVLSYLIAALLGRPLGIIVDAGYMWSMLYLSVFGSAVAFTCLLLLLERIGSARTAYSSVVLPIVALTISTFVENFTWTPIAVLGVAIALGGNALALTGKPVTAPPRPALKPG